MINSNSWVLWHCDSMRIRLFTTFSWWQKVHRNARGQAGGSSRPKCCLEREDCATREISAPSTCLEPWDTIRRYLYIGGAVLFRLTSPYAACEERQNPGWSVPCWRGYGISLLWTSRVNTSGRTRLQLSTSPSWHRHSPEKETCSNVF